MNLGYIINNAQFRPFSYAELIQPLQQQTDYQNQLEDAISQLGAQADAVGSMANQTTDPETYARYKAYSDALAQQASDLAQRGLTPGSRSILNNLRQSYSTDIVPIQNAVTRRREFEDEQRKMSLQDPTRIWQRRAGSISLDELVNNPNMDYGQSYSGAMIAQQAYQAAGNLAKEAQNSEAGRQKLRELLPYQYEYIRQRGFTSDAVLKAIQGSPEASKILTGLVDQVVASTGIQNWNDPVALQRAYDYARQGLWAAVGTQDSQIITDQWGLEQAKSALDHKYREKEMRQAQTPPPEDPNIPDYSRDVLTPGKGKVNRNEVKSLLGIDPVSGKYSKYVDVAVGQQYKTSFWQDDPGSITYKKFRLWTDKGTMLSRQQFVNQGKTQKERDILASRYNRMRSVAGKYGFNVDSANRKGGYNVSYVSKKIRMQGATTTTIEDLPMKNDDKQEVIGRIHNNARGTIREFKGFNADGSPITGRLADEDKLFEQNKDKTKYTNISTVSTPSTPAVNNGGFIITDNDGKYYWVPGNKMTKGVQATQNEVRQSLDRIDAKERELRRKYGNAAYNNSQEKEYLDAQRKQIRAYGVRDNLIQIGGTYDPGSYKAGGNSANEEP